MPNQVNNLPSYDQPLSTKEWTSKDWYLFWANVYTGIPSDAISNITVGASPFSYTAPLGGFVLLTGGTVSAVELSRDGTTYYTFPTTSGQFIVASGDVLRVTYTVLPTMVMVPK